TATSSLSPSRETTLHYNILVWRSFSLALEFKDNVALIRFHDDLRLALPAPYSPRGCYRNSSLASANGLPGAPRPSPLGNPEPVAAQILNGPRLAKFPAMNGSVHDFTTEGNNHGDDWNRTYA